MQDPMENPPPGNWQRPRSSRTAGCFMTVLGVVVLLFVILLWLMPDCSASSKRAKKARALSPDQFRELHRVMTELRASIPEEERDFQTDLWGDRIPPSLRGLNPAVVRVGGDHQVIRLEGCMDHFLDLRFYGIGEKPGVVEEDLSPRIVLWSGEFERREEVLWRGEKPAAEPK